ncbi:gliding motility protein GldC [Bacteroidota bacterium]|nr:gliding motility protein GldC [Bacteroidota bacterium]PDH49082.1 MAG: gliding motility protein GldC [Bacteroidetes bacterium MED-G20]|tara:strand:+ start:959 stop:1336 length:378 start_codon:yes stop_codon:yes gene_type:complete
MSQNKSLKKEKFSIDVLMDENLIPEDLQWNSSQGNGQSEKASAALIYLWNAQKNETFSLDLWTKKMSIEEMNKMMFQTIMTLANSYEKATSEDQLANAMRDFGEFFGEKTEILPKSGKFDGNGKR